MALSAPDGEADDLKLLVGITPAIERKLNNMGIFHYRQVAALAEADVAAVEAALGDEGCVVRNKWLDQAARLV